MQCVFHCLLGSQTAGLFGSEGVQKKDGVVHRHRKLQDSCYAIGKKGDPAKDDIAAHIDKNGDPHREHKEKRLKPRGCGGGQNQQNHHNRENQNPPDLIGEVFLEHLAVERGA